MTRPLVQIVLRIAACALLAWLAWRVAGPTVALLTVPLLGVVVARPLLDLAGELRHQARALVWRPLEGLALKFRHWAEREIAFPARRERERLGIRLAAPTRASHDQALRAQWRIRWTSAVVE